jgi:hypothetical protein
MGKRTWLVAALVALLALAGGATLASGQYDDYGGGGDQSVGGGGGGGGGSAAQGGGAAKRNLFANLTGRNELDAEGDRGAGDLDGRGGATITIDGAEVCWGITVRNIEDPIAAHIHRGKRSVNGGIEVTLSQPPTGDPGASSGCTGADAALLQEIQEHPRRFYVNVHTGDFPGGAIRGQLFGKRR